MAALTFGFSSALMAQVTNPVYFPVYDGFTDATASGGTSYTLGSKLAGQTNALGSTWYGIDTSGSAANAEYLTNILISYPGLPPGPGGNAMVLTNAAGPGTRIFTGPTTSYFLSGTSANPLTFFYSFVMQVANVTTLSTNGNGYIVGVGDNGTVGNQTTQPGTVDARLYLKQVNGTNYQVGISKTGSTVVFDPDTFTTNQVLFIVVEYQGLVDSVAGGPDIVRLWVNPAANTFGAATPPTEVTNNSTGNDFGPDISGVQFYNMANTANQTLITDYRMSTNWSWVTGGPFIYTEPAAVANISGGSLHLSVLALNNGSSNSYQWRFNGTNLSNGATVSGSGATVSGATSSTLTVSNMTPLDAGIYDVIVANAVGPVTSTPCAAASFTFPVITVQPSPTNVLFYAGGSNNYSLAITTLGLPVITNYFYSNSTVIAVSTNQSLALNNLQTSANFHVLASNSLGTTNSAVVSVTVLPLPTAPYPRAVLADHPIDYWPLNEGPDDHNGDNGVTAYDYTGVNDGVYTNVVLAAQGYGPGLAGEFGYTPPTDTSTSVAFGSNNVTSNSYVGQIPNINFGGTNAPSFSVEAWVNAQGNAQVNGAGIVSQGEGALTQFTLEWGGSGWEFEVNEVRIIFVSTSSGSFIDANWHHLVGVLDAVQGKLIIYVDGVQQNSIAYTTSLGIFPSTSPLVIGARAPQLAGALTDQFDGNIQDVAIYNYALSPTQVANHYNMAGVPPAVTIPSSTNVNEGSTLIVPSTVVGISPFTYQWYDATASASIGGQTNSILMITNISAAAYNGHNLELIVSNAFGSTTSGQLSLTIQSGPPSSVTLTPLSITTYAGRPVVFTVTAQGSEPFYYQWTTNGGIVPGVTNALYTNVVLLGGPVTIVCSVSNSFSSGSPATVSASITGVSAPTDSYALDVLGDQPLAFWRLDEPSNAPTANDFVGGHNASYENAVNGLPGFRPLAIPSETATGFGMDGITNSSLALEQDYSFNGIPQIDFSSEGANAEFSVEAWLNAPPGQKASAGIVANGYGNGGEQFCMDTGGSGGAFRFFVRNSATTIFSVNTSVLPDSNWHQLVGVCDQANGRISFYIDGAAAGTAAITPGTGVLARNSNFPVSIGSRAASSTDGNYLNQLINTSMDDVAIYNYPLRLQPDHGPLCAGLGEVGYSHRCQQQYGCDFLASSQRLRCPAIVKLVHDQLGRRDELDSGCQWTKPNCSPNNEQRQIL